MNGHEKHILSPQSINFAPSVNLGRRTSHSPARSLFNDIWAIFLINDGTVAAAKQMLNSSDDDIKTAKERLSMIEE